MATLTQEAHHDNVAARIPYKPEEPELVYGDFDEWALDCLRWLLLLAPEGAVESILSQASGVAEPYTIPATALKVVQVQHATDLDVLTRVDPAEIAAAQAHVGSGDYYATNEMSGGTGGAFGKGARIWSNVAGTVKAHRIGASDTLNVRYIDEPSWGGNTYARNNLAVDPAEDYHSYRLRLGHTSGALSEPGVGADWPIYWTEVEDDDGYSDWDGDSYDYSSTGLVIPAGWEGILAAYCARETAKKMRDPEMYTVLDKALKDELTRFAPFAQDPDESVGG